MCQIPSCSEPAERWAAIPGFEGYYEVSSHGRVRSLDREIAYVDGRTRKLKGRLLALGRHISGYPLGQFSVDSKKSTRPVHSLMAEAFIGPRPDGYEVCHNDGIHEHSCLSNLRYGTPKENQQDALRHGTNARVNRTHCPYGHLLAAPNLTRWSMAKGRRRCLACSRAYGIRAGLDPIDRGSFDFQAVADAKYRALMPVGYEVAC